MSVRRPGRVHHFEPFSFQGLMISRSAVIHCGCAIYLDDDGEVLVNACCIPHEKITTRAVELLEERGTPIPELAADTALQALLDASGEIRPKTVVEDTKR
jgi:hypothetical protein